MTFNQTILTAFLVAVSTILLIGCGGGAVSNSPSLAETPYGISLEESASGQDARVRYSGVRLDVIVPVFDPNIPEDPDDYEKLSVWPELRRTEAIRFAMALKDEIQNTNVFGSVRATPDIKVSGDLFVSGKILTSNGEDVKIEVQVNDISGARWMKKTYSHRVKEYHWQDIRQSGNDPYRPVFRQAATDIAKLLKKKSSEDLLNLRAISEIQFASAFSEADFSHHLEVKNKRVTLASLPAEDDPKLIRTRAIRVADGLFMDKMQSHYTEFVNTTNDSYVSWQEYSMESAKAQREAKSKASIQALGGILLLIGAAAAADNSSFDDDVTTAAIAAAAVGGMVMMKKSFATSREGKFHLDNLREHGSSLNLEIAPQVIKLEETTYTLQGDTKSQYRQWQKFLKEEMYERENTPAVQL